YVAFLRAINIGSRRIKMADLRDLYIELGYAEAATYIASGNVIFDSPVRPDIRRLEDAFEPAFGFRSEVFLRSEDEIRGLLGRIPWSDDEGVIDVSLLETIPDPDSARALEAMAVPPEDLVVTETEVWSLRVGGGAPSTHKESTSIKVLGMKMTRRGLNTIRKINGRFLSDPSSQSRAVAQRDSGVDL
ncbi:MAG: DUF1697 domain-containing protein, partial [Actinomycetota bacterium]